MDAESAAEAVAPTSDPDPEPAEATAAAATPSLPETDLSRFDFSDMRQFVMRPVPEGALLQMTVVRNSSGILSRFYPEYTVILSADDRFMLSAKKQSKNKSANYVMSLDKAATKEGVGYLGKVRFNFIGTEFLTYDAGAAPDPKTRTQIIRNELAYIQYDKNILGHNGPRRMLVALPNIIPTDDGKACMVASWKPLTEESQDSMAVYAKKGAEVGATPHPNLVLLANKAPEWNEKIQAHTLNFHGRVTKASVKNFQLIFLTDEEREAREREKQEKEKKKKDKSAKEEEVKHTKRGPADGSDVILQFGRTGDDNFNMDVRFPMSPYQALSICLSSLDHKLGCE
jgi:tubby and related proteins